ncbi:hypothetical protein ACIGO8_08135 [Streptomyces sp. NPDC053493]|uniref:hypothetical protein n=1 Tax=Streptomyces sp. NPDC053493 TaxID=3365705 RepID=UPI0037D216C2
MSTAIEKVNGHAVAHEPRFDPVALAEADAIRTRSEAEARARIIEAEARAKAAETLAAEEAEKLRLANERQRMKTEKEQAAHEAYLAEQAEKKARADAAKFKAEAEAADEAAEEAARMAEQQRAERLWKWGARAIYAVGLVIAAPVQFLAFWDPQRKFMVAAPALLEGLALVLACGAAWAVAHRRDVLPYRIGIMLGAAVAAAINLWHGVTDPDIGLNAGLIGAIASLGGPIVLMAYEHGIAQKADGIPSARERRAARRAKAKEDAARERAKTEKTVAEAQAREAKRLAEMREAEEQKRRDEDRRNAHDKVWQVADSLRSARGLPVVTEGVWSEAWYRVTGSKVVGITPEIEANSKAAQARMKVATDVPIIGDFSQVNSHRPPAEKKDPNAPDGRRNNGGTPPRRVPGDTLPVSAIARTQARIERTPEESK